MKRLWSCLLILAGGLGAASPAWAHEAGTSYLFIDAPREDSVPTLRWELALHDILWSVQIDADYDERVTAAELAAARNQIAAAALSQLSLGRGGVVCGLRLDDASLATRDSIDVLALRLTAQCPRSGRLEVGGFLFMDGAAGQRVLLSMSRADSDFTGVISDASPVWSEPARSSLFAAFAHFVGEGVWHVLIGYDHVAFVLLLLLPSVLRSVRGRWQGAEGFGEVLRDIVTVVTAFTLSHSLTLALAATGVVRLPAQPVEIAIALSIAAAGVVNLVPGLARLRLPLAFGFGLVHGFGFANVLAGLDAQGGTLLPLLAGFNIGVELAQLGIVAMVLPPIYFARTRDWYARNVMPLGSCALGAAGVVWLVQRL